MKFQQLLGALLPLFIVACSSDDNTPIEQPEELTAASFQVIGEDATSVFQFAYDEATENGTLTNLTEEIGVSTNYLTLRQNDEFLSFYSFNQGAFSLDIKNIRSGAFANYVDFYANGPSRSVVWGANTLTNVFFGYFAPGNDRQLGLQDVGILDETSQDFTIDFDIDLLFQPILFGGKLYITFLDNQGNYKLTLYDTDNQTLGPVLNFNNTPISVFKDSSGNLAVIKNGSEATVEIYNADNLTLVETFLLNFNTAFSPGPIEGAVLSDNKLYYPLAFVQPAQFPAGPAVFDLDSQENFAVDLVRIAEEIENEVGSRITISTQVFREQSNRFFLGYAVLESTGNQGGVIQISASGELISNTLVPFFPTDIVFD